LSAPNAIGFAPLIISFSSRSYIAFLAYSFSKASAAAFDIYAFSSVRRSRWSYSLSFSF